MGANSSCTLRCVAGFKQAGTLQTYTCPTGNTNSSRPLEPTLSSAGTCAGPKGWMPPQDGKVCAGEAASPTASPCDALGAKQPSGVYGGVYCDNARRGGRWSLVMKIKGADSAMGFTSDHWSTPSTLNAKDTDPAVDADAKYKARPALLRSWDVLKPPSHTHV